MLQITPQMKILVAVEPADFAGASTAWHGFAGKPLATIPLWAPSSSSAIARGRR